jgi:LmbE family N-acetylglucosaminyl deacetylase
MNILVIAPHPDDEAIGCGGTLRLHADRGDRITAVFPTSGELGLENLPVPEAHRIREGEAESAAAILGIARLEFLRFPDWFTGEHLPSLAEKLAAIFRAEAPARIYLPHPDDNHPDHRAAFPAACRALRLGGVAAEIFAYEVWTPLARAEEIEDITGVVRVKMRAIRCYHSQLSAFRYDRAARGLAAYRGALHAHCGYAEAFEPLLPEAD